MRQHKIGSVRIDLCYPDARVALEAQSMKWHAGRAVLQRDCDKHNTLVNRGRRLLVFTWHDVHRRPDWVACAVGEALALRARC